MRGFHFSQFSYSSFTIIFVFFVYTLICTVIYTAFFVLTLTPLWSQDSYGGWVVWKGAAGAVKLEAAIVDDFEGGEKWVMREDSPVQTSIHFVEKSPMMRSIYTDWSGYEALQKEKGAEALEEERSAAEREAQEKEMIGPNAPEFGEGSEREAPIQRVEFTPEAMFREDLRLLEESSERWKREAPPPQEMVMEARLYFHRPGKDFVVLELPESRRVTREGRPLAVSAWVYGYGKKHALYVLISNSKHGAVPVRMGNLDYYGWRRLEAAIPHALQVKNQERMQEFDFKVEGLKVVSHVREERGLYLLVVDLFTVLIDHETLDYPGSQIKDEWE